VADAVQRARDVSAKYLVVDERYTASMAPGLVPLLDPANASPQDLRLLQLVVPPYPNARVAIYEVLPKS
jgi:hypothetical protein